MKKTTDPSFWLLLVLSVGLGIWAETFGKQSDWFYLTRFGPPFMLAYVYSTREFWIDSLKERDGRWVSEYRTYLAVIVMMSVLGGATFFLSFGLGSLTAFELSQILR